MDFVRTLEICNSDQLNSHEKTVLISNFPICHQTELKIGGKCNFGFCKKSYGSDSNTGNQPWFWFPIPMVNFGCTLRAFFLNTGWNDTNVLPLLKKLRHCFRLVRRHSELQRMTFFPNTWAVQMIHIFCEGGSK